MKRNTPKPRQHSLPNSGGKFELQIACGNGGIAQRVGQSGLFSQKPEQKEIRLIGKDVLPFPPDLRTLAFWIGDNDDFRHNGLILVYVLKTSMMIRLCRREPTGMPYTFPVTSTEYRTPPARRLPHRKTHRVASFTTLHLWLLFCCMP